MSQDVERIKYKCPYCSMTFDSASDMDNHITASHFKDYNCEYCDKTFYSQADLDNHTEDVHKVPVTRQNKEEAATIYKCRKCGASFNTEIELDMHVEEAHKIRHDAAE